MEGTPFGRYRLVELLGRGGMGEVWRAYDTAIDRIVALKVLPANFADDQVYQERFRREAHAAASLDEPHVIPIYDFGEIDGRLFVTMRLVEGRDLQTLLAEGPLQPARAIGIIDQIASALNAAHRIGLVHRDVKPSNILIAENDFAYLIDFGIARAIGETALTSAGAVIGTWAYMAPERISTGHSDPRGDTYALACVLYECLTGSQPYPGSSMEQQITAHLTKPPPRPSALRHDLPSELDTVIATGMAKNPDARYPTVSELAEAARAAITVSTTGPASMPPAEPMRPTQRWADVPAMAAMPPSPNESATGGMSLSAPTQYRPATAPPLRVPAPQGAPQPPATKPRKRLMVIIAAAAVLLIAATVATITLITRSGPTPTSPGPSGPTSRSPEPRTYGAQVTLLFTGLAGPDAVAVDTAGTLYVANKYRVRVFMLPAGASVQTELPGLYAPGAVAVDAAGNLYVTAHELRNNQVLQWVLKRPAGSTTESKLPFTGLDHLGGVAVDAAGTVYVADSSNDRVVALAAGSTTQTVLPFTGLRWPKGVAVDAAGTVYVTEDNQVVMLAAGSTTQSTLPFTGLSGPEGVAVDTAGNVYVADSSNNRVLKLPAGATTQSKLPFTGLKEPEGVAVDTAGNVYVADTGNNRVVKLPVS